jgi:hypothetical protein
MLSETAMREFRVAQSHGHDPEYFNSGENRF